MMVQEERIYISDTLHDEIVQMITMMVMAVRDEALRGWIWGDPLHFTSDRWMEENDWIQFNYVRRLTPS